VTLRTRSWPRALVLPVLLLAAACSSSSHERSDSTEPGAGVTDSSTAATSAAPTGNPILFSTLYPASGPTAAPDVLAGAKAAAAAIDAAGGVTDPISKQRRPIEIVPCDADNTANPSAPSECARDVLHKGVVLDVGKYTLAGDEVDLFASAGVAMLGNSPFSQNDLTNAMSFPLAGAGASLVPGTAAALQDAGLNRIAYLSLDIPAAHAAAGFIAPILHKPDQLLAPVLLPLDPSADLTPYYARLAAEQPDGIILGVPPALVVASVAGLRQAGYTGKFVATPYTLTAEALDGLGAEAEGMLVASNYAALSSTDNPTIRRFTDEMAKYAPGAEKSEFSLNSWLAVHLAADIAPGLPKIDAPSFAAALTDRKVDLGVAPPFTLGVSDIYLGFPRVFRATVQYQVVQHGEVVAAKDGAFVNLNELAGS
jgi:ABC-type branched-subunit amino acid transport system substrate-binding protein